MRLASVYPLVTARALAREFTYEFRTRSARVRWSRCVSATPGGAASSPRSMCGAGGDRDVGGRARDRGAAACARRARVVDRGVLTAPRPRARSRLLPRAAAAARPARAAGGARRSSRRGGAGVAQRVTARSARPDRRVARRRGERELPPPRGDREREDGGVPAGVRGGARTWPRRDRACPRDRADAAGAGTFRARFGERIAVLHPR